MNISTLLEAASLIEKKTPPKGKGARAKRPAARYDFHPYARMGPPPTTKNEKVILKNCGKQGNTKTLSKDNEDDDLRIQRRPGGAGTREVHNKLEKNRRAHLKGCFEELKSQIPSMEDKKTSNLSILKSAMRYIQLLKRKEREFQTEVLRLAKEKIVIKRRLEKLKKDIGSMDVEIDIESFIKAEMEADNNSTSTATAGEDFDGKSTSTASEGAPSDDEDGSPYNLLNPNSVLVTSPNKTSLNLKSVLLNTKPLIPSTTCSATQTCRPHVAQLLQRTISQRAMQQQAKVVPQIRPAVQTGTVINLSNGMTVQSVPTVRQFQTLLGLPTPTKSASMSSIPVYTNSNAVTEATVNFIANLSTSNPLQTSNGIPGTALVHLVASNVKPEKAGSSSMSAAGMSLPQFTLVANNIKTDESTLSPTSSLGLQLPQLTFIANSIKSESGSRANSPGGLPLQQFALIANTNNLKSEIDAPAISSSTDPGLPLQQLTSIKQILSPQILSPGGTLAALGQAVSQSLARASQGAPLLSNSLSHLLTTSSGVSQQATVQQVMSSLAQFTPVTQILTPLTVMTPAVQGAQQNNVHQIVTPSILKSVPANFLQQQIQLQPLGQQIVAGKSGLIMIRPQSLTSTSLNSSQVQAGIHTGMTLTASAVSKTTT